jgi:hypothetical protein
MHITTKEEQKRARHSGQLLVAAVHKSQNKFSKNDVFEKESMHKAVVTRSNILCFHRGDNPSSQNNAFSMVIAKHNQ